MGALFFIIKPPNIGLVSPLLSHTGSILVLGCYWKILTGPLQKFLQNENHFHPIICSNSFINSRISAKHLHQ
jgi:hypothetical protein